LKSSKSELLRGLITKICEEKKMPEIKYDRWFFSDQEWKLIEYIKTRKNDLPSMEFLEKTFKFKPFKTDLTVTDHVEVFNKLFVQESLGHIFQQVSEDYRAHGDLLDEKELVRQLGAKILLTSTTISQTNNTSLNDVDALVDSYRRWSELKDPIETGFERIDAEAPFRRGELVCLIGGTGGGKSLTVQKIFAHCIKTKTPASLFSLEMNENQVLARILPILEEGGVKHSELKHTKLSEQTYRKLVEKWAGNYNIITRKTSEKIKISTIEAHLEEQIARGKPVDVVCIDYLGLMDQPLDWNADEKVSANLKRLATQYNCLIIILVQADTATLQSKAMPSITSIADNKGIARDCDIVFALKSVRNNDKDNTLTIDYAFLKRRDDGGFIDVSYRVDPNAGKWVETFTGQA
jgi:replicative DNA helicase